MVKTIIVESLELRRFFLEVRFIYIYKITAGFFLHSILYY